MSLASPHPSRLAPAPALLDSPHSIDALLAHASSPASAQQEAIAAHLGWTEFSTAMEEFVRSIDAYTVRSKMGIQARGVEHAEMMREKQGEKGRVEKQIEQERENEGKMLKTLEHERATLLDLTHHVQSISVTLQRMRDRSSALDTELARARRDASALRAEKERQRAELERQRARDGPELRRLEGALGWRIEGVRADQLLMRFTEIDPADHEREFSLVLDTGAAEYAVPRCNPPLSSMPDLVAELNKDRDFYAFIKRVRQAFRASCTAPQGEDMFRDVAALSATTANGNGSGNGLITPGRPGQLAASISRSTTPAPSQRKEGSGGEVFRAPVTPGSTPE